MHAACRDSMASGAREPTTTTVRSRTDGARRVAVRVCRASRTDGARRVAVACVAPLHLGQTLGLAALFARLGIPLPARAAARGGSGAAPPVSSSSDGARAPLAPSAGAAAPRVDFFSHVIADIGDPQSLADGLSSFGGHLQVCDAALRLSSRARAADGGAAVDDGDGGGGDDAARDVADDEEDGDAPLSSSMEEAAAAPSGAAAARPSMLVLFDELDGGTDPAQGAALSQAIIEARRRRFRVDVASFFNGRWIGAVLADGGWVL